MKQFRYFCLFLTMSSLGLLLGGCVIKPARVPTRHFVLAPLPMPEQAPVTARQSAVEVGFIKMPPYLLRDSMAVRKSPQEVDYLENALWAERLDQSFRQTLANNLSLLLTSDRTLCSVSALDRSVMRVSVNVGQFDVDTNGRGILLADWRITSADSANPVKRGQARFTRHGPSPCGNPKAIAETLGALVGDLSAELAQALRECPQGSQ